MSGAAPVLNLRLNLDAFRGDLEREMNACLGSLRTVLHSVTDGSYQIKAAEPATKTVVHMGIQQTIADPEALRRGEILKSYNSIIRALIGFIDKMIAVTEFRIDQAGFRVDRPLKTETEVLEYASAEANKILQKAVSAVAVNTSLTNPKKLARFTQLSDFSRDACLGYFALRRCIEHHNAIPQEYIRVVFRKLIILVGDQEILKLPHVVEAGGKVSIRIDHDHKEFERGRPVNLTEAELEQIVFSIKAIIAPEIANLASVALNARAAAEGSLDT